MSQIERFLPTAIKPSQGMSPGVSRPGLVLTDFSSGYQTSRDWGEISTRSIDMKVEMIGYATDGLRDFEAFLENVRVVGEVFWVVEPISGTHYGMTCGPLGDGARTCLALPISGSASGVVVMADGVPISATVHETANLFDDDKFCSPVDADDFSIGGGSDELVSFSRFGSNSLKVTGAGVSAVTVAPFVSGENVTAAAGDDINVMFDVFDPATGGRNFKITVYWIGGTPSSSTSASDLPSAENEWTIIEDSFTAPAGTTAAWVQLVDQTINTDPFYIDAIGVAPSNYDRIHLPSMAPNVIEFGTAPAEGVRVTANATGKRMVRGRLKKNGVSWAMTDPGNAVPSSLSIMEEVEV